VEKTSRLSATAVEISRVAEPGGLRTTQVAANDCGESTRTGGTHDQRTWLVRQKQPYGMNNSRPNGRIPDIRFRNHPGVPDPLGTARTTHREEVEQMSLRDDVTLACLAALRSRPWPPSSGDLELLRRAGELAEAHPAPVRSRHRPCAP
jgi:hypothetical protein